MSFAIKVDLPDPGLPVIRILGFAGCFIPKLDWFAVRRVSVGIGPGFFAFENRGRIDDASCRVNRLVVMIVAHFAVIHRGAARAL